MRSISNTVDLATTICFHAGREIEGSAKRYPQEIGYYTPLVGRRGITDINEYATPMPIRANSADSEYYNYF